MSYPANSVAEDQIRAFVERIMRLREEAKAINGDIREVYAEAKGNGFDKTILGKLVSYVEKRATGAADLQEAEALFDLYLSAYDGAVGTRVATHTHEDDHSSDLRNMVETSSPAGLATGALASLAGVEGEVDRQPITVPQHDAVEAGEDVVTAASSPDTHQAETPNEGETAEVVAVGESPAIQGMRANAGGENVEDRPVHVSEEPGLGAASVNAPAEGDTHSATIPEPETGAPSSPSVSEAGDGGAGLPAAASVVPSNVTPIRTHNPATHFLNSEGLQRLHGCLRPEACGSGQPRVKLCFGCSVQHDGPSPQNGVA